MKKFYSASLAASLLLLLVVAPSFANRVNDQGTANDPEGYKECEISTHRFDTNKVDADQCARMTEATLIRRSPTVSGRPIDPKPYTLYTTDFTPVSVDMHNVNYKAR